MRWIAITALLTGCGSQIGTETGFGCLVDDTEAIGDLGAAPAGFSEPVQAMLDRVAGRFDGAIALADGAELDLTMVVTVDGDPVVERRSWQDDAWSGGAEPAIGVGECPDVVRIPARVTLSAPPALDEAIAASIFVDPSGAGQLFLQIDWEDLQGDARPFGFDPADMAEVGLHVSAATSDAGWSGDVSFFGESFPSGSGPDASVSATNDAWGELSVDRAE